MSRKYHTAPAGALRRGGTGKSWCGRLLVGPRVKLGEFDLPGKLLLHVGTREPQCKACKQAWIRAGRP